MKPNIQPGEEKRLQNFLNRGTRDQLKLFPNNNPQTQPPMRVTNKIVGYSWNEPNTLEEMENMKNIADEVLGRELQTLEDVRKIAKRLKDRGYDTPQIKAFLMKYANVS